MTYQYKLLTSSDLNTFKELLMVFGQVFNEFDTYQKFVPSDSYLSSLLSKDHFISIVALEKEKVVGGLAAYVLEKFEQDRKEIYIYDLAVLENYRRKGIATQLIKKLKEQGRVIGAYVIFVQADHGDDPAIRLYESLGIREEVLHFDIGL